VPIDVDRNARVEIAELIAAVGRLLDGCTAPIVVTGGCFIPGTNGLVSCPSDTAVRVLRCKGNLTRCLREGAQREFVAAAQTDSNGTVRLSIDPFEVVGKLLIFEAIVDPSNDTAFRVIDIGAAGPSTEASRAQITINDTMRFSPGSEASFRLIDDVGVENVFLAYPLRIREATGTNVLVLGCEGSADSGCLPGTIVDVFFCDAPPRSDCVGVGGFAIGSPPAEPFFCPPPIDQRCEITTQSRLIDEGGVIGLGAFVFEKPSALQHIALLPADPGVRLTMEVLKFVDLGCSSANGECFGGGGGTRGTSVAIQREVLRVESETNVSNQTAAQAADTVTQAAAADPTVQSLLELE
jgi:hypothetical protein